MLPKRRELSRLGLSWLTPLAQTLLLQSLKMAIQEKIYEKEFSQLPLRTVLKILLFVSESTEKDDPIGLGFLFVLLKYPQVPSTVSGTW